MAEIIVLVGTVDQFAASAGMYRIAGVAEVNGSPAPITWETFVNFTDNTVQVNKACIDAAVAAANADGFTIFPSDAKTLFASAVLG